MKKIVSVIATCLLACIMITGLVSGVAFATEPVVEPAPTTQSFDKVVEYKPETVRIGDKLYYRVRTTTEKIGTEDKTEKVSAIRKWKWVANNPSIINKDVVVVEENLDFSGYTDIKALSYSKANQPSKIPIAYSIKGGVITNDGNAYKFTDDVKTISNLTLKLNNTTPAFIDRLDGGEIKSLHFDNCNYTGTVNNGYVGGVVGVMRNGLISQVSFTNSNITAGATAIGGIAGKVINGDIYSCDFQGTLDGSATNTTVGGIVGEYSIGERLNGNSQVNTASIWNSYFNGNILAGTYAGGIIGNMDFKISQFDKNKSIANIKVQNVYAKLTKIHTTNKMIKPNGILGNIVMYADGYLEPGPLPEVKPGQPPVPPENLLNVSGITFTNGRSSFSALNSDNTSVTIEQQFPKDFPTTQYKGFRTLINDEFALASSFEGFDNSIWIMPDKKDYDLQYKYISNIDSERNKLRYVHVATVGNAKSSSVIAEKDNNNRVPFVKGDPIIMTILEQDGVHVETIKAVIKNGVTTTNVVVYSKGVVVDANNTTFNKDKAQLQINLSIGQYMINGNNLFPSDNSKVTFEFDYSRENTVTGQYELAYNDYNVKFRTFKDYKEYDIEKDEPSIESLELGLQNDIKYQIGNEDKIIPVQYSDASSFKFNHNDVLIVYIKESLLVNKIINGITVTIRDDLDKVKSFEKLENKETKGYNKINNVVIDGDWYEKYEIRLNLLSQKLHDGDNIDLELLFIGRTVNIDDYLSFRIADQNGVDLVNKKILDVSFIDDTPIDKDPNANIKKRVNHGDKVKLSFKLTDAGNASGNIFNLYGKINDKDPDYIQFVKIGQEVKDIHGNKTIVFDKKAVVTYDPITKTFTTGAIYQLDGEYKLVDANKIEAFAGMKVEVDLVQKKSVNIKEVNGLYNAPSFRISNVPIIVDGAYLAGYCSAGIYYDFNKADSTSTPSVNDVTKTIGLTEVGDKDLTNLFSVNSTTKAITFISLMGIDNKIDLIENTNRNTDDTANTAHNFYTGLSYYTINSIKRNFCDISVKDCKKSDLKLSEDNKTNVNIELFFNIKEKKIEVTPEVADVLWEKKNIVKPFKYGDKISLTRFKYVADYEKDFKFEGWIIPNDTPNGNFIQKDNISFVFDDELFNAIMDNEPYKVKFKMAPYFKLKVTSSNLNIAKIYRNGKEVGFGDKTTLYFTDEYNNIDNKLTYIIDMNNPKYIINEKSLIDTSLLLPYPSEGTEVKVIKQDSTDNTRFEITIDIDKCIESLELYKKQLDLGDVSSLTKEIVVQFDEKKFNLNLKVQTYNENGELDGFGKGGSIELYDMDGNLIEDISAGVTYGNSLTFKVKAFSYYDINWYTTDDVEFTSDQLKNVKTDYIIDHMIAEYHLDNITEDVNILIKFNKSKEQLSYRINDAKVEIGHYENGKWVFEQYASLADCEFMYDFNFSAIDRTKIPTKVGDNEVVSTISFNIKNDRYKFAEWASAQVVTKDEIPELTSVASPYFTITAIDGNYNNGLSVGDYVLILRLVRKTYNVKVSVPVGHTIKIIASLDGDMLGIPAFKSTVDKSTFDMDLFYGTNLLIYYDNSTNPDFTVNKWMDNLNDYYTNAQQYDISLLKENVDISLLINQKITAQSTINKQLKVKHHMHYDSPNAQTGRTVIYPIIDKDSNVISKVTLKAEPSKDAEFVKWYKKDATGKWVDFEGNNNAIIDVLNDESEYSALFELKTYNLTFGNEDLVQVTTSKQNPKNGDQVELELNIKPGYVIDKVIINGTEEIMLGNQKKVTLYNVDEDMDIKFVYRKVGQNEEEAKLDGAVKKVLIATVIVAIVLSIITKKVYKAKGYKKNKIKINID